MLMRVVLDTNCFIYAFNPSAPMYGSMQSILQAAHSGKIILMVSLHTLSELEKKPDAAYKLAKTAEKIPYWTIGSIGELVGTIAELAGTIQDMSRNEEIQEELEKLAKSGNDIRDRGAYIDALKANADAFVTSDKHLVGSGQAQRIREKFGLRVLTPLDLVSEMTKSQSF